MEPLYLKPTENHGICFKCMYENWDSLWICASFAKLLCLFIFAIVHYLFIYPSASFIFFLVKLLVVVSVHVCIISAGRPGSPAASATF